MAAKSIPQTIKGDIEDVDQSENDFGECVLPITGIFIKEIARRDKLGFFYMLGGLAMYRSLGGTVDKFELN